MTLSTDITNRTKGTIRDEALALGLSDKETADKIGEIAAGQNYLMTVSPEEIPALRSAYEKRMAAKDGSPAPAKTMTRATTAKTTEPTVAALLGLSAAIRKEGSSVEEVESQLAAVEKWSEKVGGFDQLRACLSALSQLSVK